MKNIKYITFLCISLLLLFSCKSKKKINAYEGELFVYADTNIASLMEQYVPVFENIHPKIKVKIICKYEDELLDMYFANKTNSIILSRKLSENEIAYANQQNSSETAQFTFAYDAIAAFTNSTSKDTFFDIDNYQTKKLVFDNAKSGIIKSLFSDTLKKIPALIANHENSVFSLVQSNTAIGFIQFNQISNKYSSKDFYNKFKLLSIKNNNKIYQLNQEQIFQDIYPFIRELTVISTKSMNAKQRLFFRFLFKERSAKLILHHGIVPAKIPAIEINVIDKNYEVEQ